MSNNNRRKENNLKTKDNLDPIVEYICKPLPKNLTFILNNTSVLIDLFFFNNIL